MIREFAACHKARVCCTWLVTDEEIRAEAAIAEYIQSLGGQTWVWSLTSNDGAAGWEPPVNARPDIECPFDQEVAAEPGFALRQVINAALNLEEKVEAELEAAEEAEATGKEYEESGLNSAIVAIIRDPHYLLEENPHFVRTLRDASRELKDTTASIVCISAYDELPRSLRTDVEIIRPGLPDVETLEQLTKATLRDYEINPKENECRTIAETCVGLTLNQLSDAIAKSLTRFGRVSLSFLRDIKTTAISSVPGLTYIHKVPSMDDVGGLAGLKEWVKERKDGFSQEARDFNLPIPKGALCLGVSGCGKSLFAKAIASYFGVPLINLNPADAKKGIVGGTEENLRLIKEAVEAVGNCVLWETTLELEDGQKIPIGEAYDRLEFPIKIKGFCPSNGKETLIKMLNILKRPKKIREILTIELESGRAIQVTDNHKLLVKTANGSPIWKEAWTLSLNDDIIETTQLTNG